MTTLLVASTGGHLKQLHRLHTRLSSVSGPFHWATFDTPQSRSLLAGESVDFVRFVGGRDPVNNARNLKRAGEILRRNGIDTVVSTGSAVALPFFLLGRALKLRCIYVESAARSSGPSLTGKMIAAIPGVSLYTQYAHWARGRWQYQGSVFDTFEPRAQGDGPTEIRRAVVTLGTYEGYGFPKLLRRAMRVLPSDAEVLWQTGDTDARDLSIDAVRAMPEADLLQAMAAADVVIAHAGVGSALAALEVGKKPVLVPRRLSRGEHVDDHQIQIADELSKRGLAVSVDVDDLSRDDLLAAASSRIATVEAQPLPVDA